MLIRPARRLAVLLALVALALPLWGAAADRKAPAPLVEGSDYELIEGGAPFAPLPGKVEVAEVFGYSCPHCAHFEPALARWKATLPRNATFVAVAAPFGGMWMPFARAYYAARILGVAERSHADVFKAVHDTGALPHNPSGDELATFYAHYGVAPAKFLETYAGPAVDAQMARARAFIQRSGVDGTPTLVVAGRYRVLGANQQDSLRIAMQLVQRERGAR